MQNIFRCECCACTNHTGHMPDPVATTETYVVEETAPIIGHSPSKRQDLTKENQEPNQDNLVDNKQEYPDSEIDAWDWDELEASIPTAITQPIQSPTTSPPVRGNEGTTRDPGHNGSPDHETDHNMCPLFLNSMTKRMASVPNQSFPDTWQPMIGAPVMVYTGGDAHKWRVCHIKQGIGTSITITHEHSEMIVDKSWFMFDTHRGSLVLQRLGFFSDNTLKRTTNSSEIWRNILNSDKMMDGEILMVLLEWTIHGNPSREDLGLPKALNTSWLVGRSFWQSWVQNNEPQIVHLATSKEWVCIDREPTWGTEVSHNVLCNGYMLLHMCNGGRYPSETICPTGP